MLNFRLVAASLPWRSCLIQHFIIISPLHHFTPYGLANLIVIVKVLRSVNKEVIMSKAFSLSEIVYLTITLDMVKRSVDVIE